MTDVLLVQMPFSRLALPSVGLAIVSSALTRAGIGNRVRYENIRFAERLGLSVYSACGGLFATHSIHEWAFARAAFPDHRPDPAPLFADARQRLPFAAHLIAAQEFDSLEDMFRALREQAESFLDQLVEDVLAEQPRIVGCTSMFSQHVPALALLRRLKERAPGLVTVMGGAACAQNMGRVTHRRFDWVDYLFLGEADDIAACVFGEILAGRAAELPQRPEARGVLCPEDRGRTGPPKVGHVVEVLDEAPVPDYSDYLSQLRASPLGPMVDPGLIMEFSRGCWWAAARRCTFCGIESYNQRQRNKTPARITSELRQLLDRHGVDRITVVDNAVERHLIPEVFQEVAGWERKPKLFLETRPDLTREQLELMAAAGCRWIQTGIESLDDDALHEMQKGASTARNLQLLKWAREVGVELQWNVIVDLPGEPEERYERMADLVPLLTHLENPANVGPLFYVRNGAYHENPERYGLSLEPDPMYRQLFPFSEADVAEYAYVFRNRGEPTRLRRDTPARKRLHEELERWMLLGRSTRPARLVATDDGTRLDIEDTRPVAPQPRLTLEGVQRDLCLALADGPGTPDQVLRALGARAPQGGWPALEPYVEELIARKLVVRVKKWLVALPVRPRARAAPRREESPLGHIQTAKVYAAKL